MSRLLGPLLLSALLFQLVRVDIVHDFQEEEGQLFRLGPPPGELCSPQHAVVIQAVQLLIMRTVVLLHLRDQTLLELILSQELISAEAHLDLGGLLSRILLPQLLKLLCAVLRMLLLDHLGFGLVLDGILLDLGVIIHVLPATHCVIAPVLPQIGDLLDDFVLLAFDGRVEARSLPPLQLGELGHQLLFEEPAMLADPEDSPELLSLLHFFWLALLFSIFRRWPGLISVLAFSHGVKSDDTDAGLRRGLSSCCLLLLVILVVVVGC